MKNKIIRFEDLSISLRILVTLGWIYVGYIVMLLMLMILFGGSYF